MQTKHPHFLSLLVFAGIAQGASSPPPASEQSTSNPNTKPTEPALPATPFPRRILFPKIKAFWIRPESHEPQPAIEQPTALEFEKNRFSLVLTMASWNPTSQVLLNTLATKTLGFDKRSVQIVILFPEETKTTFENFVLKLKPSFLTGRVAPDSVSATRSLMLPAAWIVNNRSEVIGRWGRISEKEIETIVGKLTLWTGF